MKIDSHWETEPMGLPGCDPVLCFLKRSVPCHHPSESEGGSVEARNRTLFRKPADSEDGKLMSANNHLVGVWMPGSFMDQR